MSRICTSCVYLFLCLYLCCLVIVLATLLVLLVWRVSLSGFTSHFRFFTKGFFLCVSRGRGITSRGRLRNLAKAFDFRCVFKYSPYLEGNPPWDFCWIFEGISKPYCIPLFLHVLEVSFTPFEMMEVKNLSRIFSILLFVFHSSNE